MSKPRPRMARHNVIVARWRPLLTATGRFTRPQDFLAPGIAWRGWFMFKWSALEYRCFRCRRPYVQRAHIQAVMNGGSNDASNLHLLCLRCHAESECLSGPGYWSWFFACPTTPGQTPP